MAPLQKELSSLEVEPLEIVIPRREGFYTPPGVDTLPQDRSLDTLTATLNDVEIAALLTDRGSPPVARNCCCCCPVCCC